MQSSSSTGGHEQLLVARRVAALAGELLAVSDEKVFDATSNIEVVDAGQQGFEPFEGPCGHDGSMRERARGDRADAELQEQAVRALAAGLVPELVEAQHVARRMARRALADLVQRVDEWLELALELREDAAEHALRAVEGRLRERAVGAAAHRDVVVDVHGAAREAASKESRDEERDVAEALQRAEAVAIVRRIARLGEEERERLQLRAVAVGLEEGIGVRRTSPAG